MFSIVKPFIFNFDPETAHDLAIKALKFNYLPKKMFEVENEEMLNIEVLGKHFPNPIGLAAGFDKSAEVYNSLLKLGFGFVEVGTVTPLKQLGSTKPRVFRLEEDSALINRLGFNNDGIEIIKNRIKEKRKNGILGINIGPNKDTKDQEEDFCLGLKNFFDLADYITINISSPNTENLRNFHDEKKFDELINSMEEEKIKLKSRIPIVVKISPDISDNQINLISEILLKYKVSAVIVSNTTENNRKNLKNILKHQKGGLSGKPLEEKSNKLIAKFYDLLKGKIQIIGVGGVDSGKSAYNKFLAGANYIQLYTGMVFQGPNIVVNIKKELKELLINDGVTSFKEIIGKKHN